MFPMKKKLHPISLIQTQCLHGACNKRERDVSCLMKNDAQRTFQTVQKSSLKRSLWDKSAKCETNTEEIQLLMF